MIQNCRQLTDIEIILLRSLIGKTLSSIDACIVARCDTAWGTVRFHLPDRAIDINIQLGETLVSTDGSIDEFGYLSLCEGQNEQLELREVSPDTTTYQVDKTIDSISIANERISITEVGQSPIIIETCQAIIFEIEGNALVLDRESWFSDMITIKVGSDYKELLYDDTTEWVDDPEEDPLVHYEANTEVVTLA